MPNLLKDDKKLINEWDYEKNRDIKFHLKRLCGYKLEQSINYPHDTFMVIYSDGLVAKNWIYKKFK